MDGLVEDFLSQFHNISGTTLSERKKSAFQLFHSHSHLKATPIVLGEICARLQPENHLERVFMVDFFLHFQCFRELYREFITGNNITIAKISKAPWFFRQVSQEFGVRFVQEILPNVSFSLRLKILRQVCPYFDEQQNDQIFDMILAKYGVTVATHMITNCSVGKIQQILKNYPLCLWETQLKLFHKKSRDLIILYMSERQKLEGNNEFMSYDPFARYLAEKDPDLYCELVERYVLKCRIGKRTTKKLVILKRNEILSKSELYSSNQFRLDRFVRTMGVDFKHFYLKIFPKKLSEVGSGDAERFLKYYAKNGRFHLFANTFKQVFNHDLEEFPLVMNEHLFRLIPSIQEKEKWSSLLVTTDEARNEDTLKYSKPEECFGKIMKTFNTSRESSDRSVKLALITKSCILYDDYQTLDKLFELIFTRFKNDYFYSKLQPIQQLLHYEGDFKKLTQKQWDYINNLLDSEKPEFFSQYLDVKLAYFQFLYRQGKSLQLGLENDFKATNHNPIDFIYKNSEPVFKKVLLLSLLQLPLKKPTETLEFYHANLVLAICKYNENCGKINRIKIFAHPDLIKSLIKLLSDENKDQVLFDQLALNLHKILTEKCNDGDLRENFYKVIVQNFDEIASLPLARWFLFNRPQLVLDNLEKYLESCIEKYRNWNWNSGVGLGDRNKIWLVIKTQHFLKIDQKTIDFCLKKLNDPEYPSKYLLSTPLSVLLNPEDYLKLLETYAPLADSQGESENDKKLFQLQTNLIYSLKSVNNLQISALQIILKYMRGDYLRHGLSSLLKFCYFLSESEVNLAVNQLEKVGAISVRKHAFFITCALLDEPTRLKAMKSSKLIQSLSTILKYFLRNPSEEVWELVQLKLPKLDKTDNFTSKLVTEACVHFTYKARYFVKAWEVLNASENKFKHVLINRIHKETIDELPFEFCSKIIEKDLFKIPKMNDFVGNYLIFVRDPSKFQLIMSILSRFKSESWDRKEAKSREKLTNLVEAIFKMYMQTPNTDLNFVNDLISNFEKNFTHVEIFEDFVVLSLMKFKNQSKEELSRSISELNNNLITTYDALIIDVVASCLTSHLKFLTSAYSDFLMNLLKNRRSKYDVILVIRLLPKDQELEVGENAETYSEILEIIEQCDDVSVRLQFQLYVKEVGSNPALNFKKPTKRLLLSCKRSRRH